MNVSELKELVEDFFNQADYSDITKPKFQDDQELLDYFDNLAEDYEVTSSDRPIDQNIIIAFEELLQDTDLDFLIEFSKRVNPSSKAETAINEEVKSRLKAFHDILKLDEYSVKTLLGSSTEAIFLTKQMEILKNYDVEVTEVSSLDDIVELPAYYIKMLQRPELVPESLRQYFVYKVKFLNRCLQKLSREDLSANLRQSPSVQEVKLYQENYPLLRSTEIKIAKIISEQTEDNVPF